MEESERIDNRPSCDERPLISPGEISEYTRYIDYIKESFELKNVYSRIRYISLLSRKYLSHTKKIVQFVCLLLSGKTRFLYAFSHTSLTLVNINCNNNSNIYALPYIVSDCVLSNSPDHASANVVKLNRPVYALKKEYESEPETENEPPKKMADLGPRKFEGIGPVTREGIPLVLRSVGLRRIVK